MREIRITENVTAGAAVRYPDMDSFNGDRFIATPSLNRFTDNGTRRISVTFVPDTHNNRGKAFLRGEVAIMTDKGWQRISPYWLEEQFADALPAADEKKVKPAKKKEEPVRVRKAEDILKLEPHAQLEAVKDPGFPAAWVNALLHLGVPLDPGVQKALEEKAEKNVSPKGEVEAEEA